jgi:hypothetical protein
LKSSRVRQFECKAPAQAKEAQLRLDVDTLFELTREVRSSFAVERGLSVAQRLNAAYHETSVTQVLTLSRATVGWLKRLSAAATRPEEGMEEAPTVVRLGVHEPLRRTFSFTNRIDSGFSVAESVNRWREGNASQRWCMAGLVDAKSRFNRVRGSRQLMPY